MRLKEDIEPMTLLDATMLLQLAGQAEADLQEGRVLPQKQALERVRSRLSILARLKIRP